VYYIIIVGIRKLLILEVAGDVHWAWFKFENPDLILVVLLIRSKMAPAFEPFT